MSSSNSDTPGGSGPAPAGYAQGPSGDRRPVTIARLLEKKRRGLPISMITAYDYPTAAFADAAGFDMLLVGDSVANVVLGHKSTLPVTLDQMVYHTSAVARGRQTAFLVGDMPFLSYQADATEAVKAAGRFLKEADADAVKLEGGDGVLDAVRAIVRAGIPVMGHLGLTPQSVSMLSGYRVQGKTSEGAKKILDEALRLQDAGVFSLVLECVPTEVAGHVARRVEVPVIGIGAGDQVDGQVLVFHDALGLAPEGVRVPKFVRRYAELGRTAVEALGRFRGEVDEKTFPSAAESFAMPAGELRRFEALIGDRPDDDDDDSDRWFMSGSTFGASGGTQMP